MDLVQQLRDRACPAGLPHTGENPEEDHGHTDCWLHYQAADEIERLRSSYEHLSMQYRLSLATLQVLTDPEETGSDRALMQLHARDQLNAWLKEFFV